MSTTWLPPSASCVCWLRAFRQRGPKELRQALLEMRSGGNSSRPRPRPQHWKGIWRSMQVLKMEGCRFLVQIIWIKVPPLDTIVATNCASKSVVFLEPINAKLPFMPISFSASLTVGPFPNFLTSTSSQGQGTSKAALSTFEIWQLNGPPRLFISSSVRCCTRPIATCHAAAFSQEVMLRLKAITSVCKWLRSQHTGQRTLTEDAEETLVAVNPHTDKHLIH